MTTTTKLKILCLHGYRQDGASFKSKLGAFRKMLASEAEFTFVTAPVKVPGNESSEESGCNQCGWWLSNENSFSAHETTHLSIGLNDSIKTIQNTFIKEGPFDGILGFSQGACFTAMLAGLLQQQKLEDVNFKFVIIVAGFISKSTAHVESFTNPIQLPSLHVYGETDAVIPKKMSEDLKDLFVEAEIIVHPGGHYLPAGKLKAEYIDFFRKMASMCSNN